MKKQKYDEWYEGESDDNSDDEYSFKEYDITAQPNDFNIITIFNYIEKGIFKIPDFQRNYVWDLKRASKLIESIIIGIPIPQIFLYELSKNKLLVIDGQQRLMTIYYFIKKRFPKKEKRSELKKIFDKEGKIPENILNSDEYFKDFNLRLPSSDKPNKLNGLNYSTLDDEHKQTFELKTIRNIIIKQNLPNDNSSIYEIFNRLNTGGVNLKPQEIRESLYHSEFFEMLYRINCDKRWRRLLKQPNPDDHRKDIEILLKGFAMLMCEEYKPSMIRFLNNFSNKMKNAKKEDIDYLENLFDSFLKKCQELSENAFMGKTNRFNISMYEAVFATVCKEAYKNKNLDIVNIEEEKLNILKNNDEFIKTITTRTTNKNNVDKRLELAAKILLN